MARRRNEPEPSYDLDGGELRLTLVIHDIETVSVDDIPDSLWDAFVAAREEYREGQRTAQAYEDTVRTADEARNGGLR